ncbi:hypothetical protein B0H14DRAFT_2625374 [Mycena olivaceomarginata]|nr:hypothetical protein B0H14DRAFT_2625374 [Mycena olivaceomarginata]
MCSWDIGFTQLSTPLTPRQIRKFPEFFVSTCADLFAQMFNTVPNGVQFTEVITPLPVKQDQLLLILDGDTLQFSGVSLTVAEQQAQRYFFPTLSLVAAVGTTSLRFTIDGKLVDQGGLGFLVQADVGWFILREVNPTRVYLETDERDSVDCPIVVGIDMEPPSQPLAANASYLMWNLELNTTQRFTSFTIGAEINGVKGTRNGPYSRFDFTQGANSSIAAAV